LADLLEELVHGDDGLTGTGYDGDDLDDLRALLAPPISPSNEWVGMPEFKQDDLQPYRQIIVSFDPDMGEAAVKDFVDRLGIRITDKTKSMWWPPRERETYVDEHYAAEP
jgi:hypothetical protein